MLTRISRLLGIEKNGEFIHCCQMPENLKVMCLFNPADTMVLPTGEEIKMYWLNTCRFDLDPLPKPDKPMYYKVAGDGCSVGQKSWRTEAGRRCMSFGFYD